MGYEIADFGTFYLRNGSFPQPIPKVAAPKSMRGDIPMYDGNSEFSLGDTVPGMELPWVKPDGMDIFVSQKVLLCKVSWRNIDAYGLLNKTIMIDGRLYRCRLPYIGENPKDKDEWKAIASEVHRAPEFWGFGHVGFWGQDCYGGGSESEFATTRGFGFQAYTPNTRLDFIGYRPVLEPITPSGDNPNTVVLDGEKFVISQQAPFRENVFCPVLAKKAPGLTAGVQMISGMEDGTTVRMYTLLMDGVPVDQSQQKPITYKKDAKLSFSDKFYGAAYLIPWRFCSGYAYAAHNILRGISDEELARQGFVAHPKT